jgi:flagellar basal-body rod protein FlgG
LQKGTGAKLANTDTVYKVGNMQQTDRSLDFAITQTNGYFAVQTGAEIKYTRNGNFKLSAENGVNYLTTAEGGYILDAGGQRITVASEEDDIDIGVYSFTNENGLTREGETYYVANNTSGEATAITNAAIKTGFLEGSSVNIADEMTAVIQLQRAFQMNSKIVQISDELMQTVNSLR